MAGRKSNRKNPDTDCGFLTNHVDWPARGFVVVDQIPVEEPDDSEVHPWPLRNPEINCGFLTDHVDWATRGFVVVDQIPIEELDDSEVHPWPLRNPESNCGFLTDHIDWATRGFVVVDQIPIEELDDSEVHPWPLRPVSTIPKIVVSGLSRNDRSMASRPDRTPFTEKLFSFCLPGQWDVRRPAGADWTIYRRLDYPIEVRTISAIAKFASNVQQKARIRRTLSSFSTLTKEASPYPINFSKLTYIQRKPKMIGFCEYIGTVPPLKRGAGIVCTSSTTLVCLELESHGATLENFSETFHALIESLLK
jgi:hypothetical protein